MSKVVLAKTDKISHAKWLQFRQHGIGGSDASAVCGMNRWRGPLDVYLDKLGKTPAQEDNEAMYWGRTMEPVLRDEFAKRTGKTVEAMPYMFSCKEYPFMIADIDGIVREEDGSVSLLELKTANGFATADWESGLPQEYYIQIQHYLSVCDLPKAYVAVLIGGNHFQYEELARDEDTIRMVIAMEKAFWHNNILGVVPPKADETSGPALDTLYPASGNTSIILPDEADQLIKQLNDLKEVEAQVKAEKTKTENQIKALLKDAECGKTPAGYSVRWKTSSTSRLDTTKLKAEQPDIVAKYTKTSSYRRFSITAPKEKK